MDNNNQKVYPPIDNSYYPPPQQQQQFYNNPSQQQQFHNNPPQPGFQNPYNNNMNQPPSYQIDQIQSMPVVTQQPTTVIMHSPVVGPDPTIMTCPGCRATITTTVIHEAGNKTHLFALGLCLIGCWPCCLYPYCIDSCQNANHTCPNCNAFVGSYKN